MTALPLAAGRRPLLPPALVEDLARHEPILTRFAALLLVLALPTLIAMSIDTRTYQGVNVWLKPFKFELSLAIYALTLAVFAAYIDRGFRKGRPYRVMVVAVPMITLFNFGYILFRAARAEGSHFNRETLLAETIYSVAGLAAVIQISLAILFGYMILRSHERALTAPLRLSIGLGLIAGAVLTIAFGGYMGMQANHWVGGVQNDAHGIPFFGWSRTGGDLRIAHFVGMHAMQALPLVGWAASGLSERVGKRVVVGALLAWIGLTIALFVQALAGQPLFPR